jgi:hypothetical protein
VSPVKYELGFYIPEDDSLHKNERPNFIKCWNFFKKSEQILAPSGDVFNAVQLVS